MLPDQPAQPDNELSTAAAENHLVGPDDGKIPESPPAPHSEHPVFRELNAILGKWARKRSAITVEAYRQLFEKSLVEKYQR